MQTIMYIVSGPSGALLVLLILYAIFHVLSGSDILYNFYGLSNS
jgi:hypothetical protein